PAAPPALALASGLAFVADSSSGLQVVNFLGFDTEGVPPEVSAEIIDPDLDPARPGLQLLEGSTVRLSAHVSDDVQGRNVEVLVNGMVVRNEVTYPYDLTATLPTIQQAGTAITLQVRATDTGGNSTLSDPISIELVPGPPPTITQVNPPDGSTQPLT